MKVPSLMEVAQENAGQHLSKIQEGIPIFKLIGKEFLVKKTR